MIEEVEALGLCEVVDEDADAIPECRDGSLGGLTEQRLELREGHLDRIEIRRIGRQIEELGAGKLDPLSNAIDLVSWQIVHDDDVTWA